MSRVTLFILLVLFVLGCTQNNQQQSDSDFADTNAQNNSGNLSDTVRVITLPTPMQIPALLRNTKAPYDKSILLPIKKDEQPYFKSNVLFGMYMIDMAYASSFSDKQTAIQYFLKCRALGNHMGLATEMDERLAERFTKNTERPDSLGRIILEMYERGHSYFRENDKEGIGLIMIMGCLFEGLHLTFEEARDHDKLMFIHLLNQQKLYASNLIYAFSAFEIPDEVKVEHDMLLKAYDILDRLHPPSIYDIKTGKASVKEIDPAIIDELETLCKEFRLRASS